MTLARGNHDVGGPRPSRGSSYWSRDRLEPIGVNALPPGVEGKKRPCLRKIFENLPVGSSSQPSNGRLFSINPAHVTLVLFFFRPDRYHGS